MYPRIRTGKLYIVMILPWTVKWCFKSTQISDISLKSILSWCWSVPVFVVQLSCPLGLCAGLPAVLYWCKTVGVSCHCLDFTPRAPLTLSDTPAGSQTGTASLTQAHICLTSPQQLCPHKVKIYPPHQDMKICPHTPTHQPVINTHNANSHLGPI